MLISEHDHLFHNPRYRELTYTESTVNKSLQEHKLEDKLMRRHPTVCEKHNEFVLTDVHSSADYSDDDNDNEILAP